MENVYYGEEGDNSSQIHVVLCLVNVNCPQFIYVSFSLQLH